MRKARVILFLLLVGGTAAAYYYAQQNGWQLPTVPEAPAPASNPQNAQLPAPDGANAARPTFDVVRAEPTGELIIAGRAEPGWAVTVESNGKTIGSAMADGQGEWVIQPEAPVSKGEHSLELKSQSPKGKQLLFSKQRLALSIGQTNKSQPLVALTEEGQATRVLQMPQAAPDEKRTASASASSNAAPNLQNPPYKADTTPEAAPAQVTFTSIDYEQLDGRNTVYLTGRAAPAARIMLYVDNEFTGTTTTDATGSWSFKGIRELNSGKHFLRADHVEVANGKVVARAEVNFDREAPKAIAMGTAQPTPAQSALASASPQVKPAGSRTEVADASSAADDDSPASNVNALGLVTGDLNPRVIVVRRGDTLWQLAQRHYGDGARYTQIFQNNKGQIRNPNLIYPTQRFQVEK
jgi:nucleoid-associated protein YgaU